MMFDPSQLLERYRLLSRDIQNGLQNAQKQVGALPKHVDSRGLSQVLSEINESWQDFAGWILVSTLDDLADARKNCAPGRLDVQSKMLRSKLRRTNETRRNGITISATDTESLVIESFIPYFEQMLDLLVGNAIKYSPRGGHIELKNERTDEGCRLVVSSMGPFVQRHEVSSLGLKGFRCDSAKKCPVTGDGYGLFNVKRIAELLGGHVSFHPGSKVLAESGGIQYAEFEVHICLPEFPPSYQDLTPPKPSCGVES